MLPVGVWKMFRRLQRLGIRLQVDSTGKKRFVLIAGLNLALLAIYTSFNDSKGHVMVYRNSRCPCNRNIVSNSPANGEFHWCSEETTLRGPRQSVVSYTLFPGSADGIADRYRLIFDTIPKRIKEFFPDWRVRVYFGLLPNQTSELHSICEMYCRHDNVDICDVVDMARSLRSRELNGSLPVASKEFRQFGHLNWRFLPLMDPAVDRMMSRDADSEINSREVAAVNEWLQSDCTFHVMRDHPSHSSAIMAGMFGAKIYRDRRVIQSLTKSMVRLAAQKTEKSGKNDQYLLDAIFWPTVKDDAMIHDSYHCQVNWNSGEIRPFPTQRDANKTFVSDRPGSAWKRPTECPAACRPRQHQDWIYC